MVTLFLPFILKGLQKITPFFLKGCKIFWRECEGLDPKIRVIALQFYSLTLLTQMLVEFEQVGCHLPCALPCTYLCVCKIPMFDPKYFWRFHSYCILFVHIIWYESFVKFFQFFFVGVKNVTFQDNKFPLSTQRSHHNMYSHWLSSKYCVHWRPIHMKSFIAPLEANIYIYLSMYI